MTLEQDARSLEFCTYCPKLCRHACPVSNAVPREAIIPQQKMQSANLLRRGQLPWRPEYTEVVYACTGCGACTEVCAHRIEPGRVLMEARAAAEARGVGHPALADLEARFWKRSTRLAQTMQALVPAAERSQDARIAFHPGCDTIESAPDDLAATRGLLARLAEHVRVTDTQVPCGGYPLWAAGQGEAFRAAARRFASALAGHAEVISTCPACVYLAAEVYPREGIALRPRMLHVVEALESHLERLPAATDGERAPALYHDSCFLGRHRGLYDGPRRLLSRVAEVREFSRARAEAECSGGGALVPKTMPEVAQAMAHRRLREARENGMSRVVTACPTCKKQLSRAAGGVEVVDLAALLARTASETPP